MQTFRQISEFELGDVLGVGTVGTIYHASEKSSGKKFALKKLHPGVSQDQVIRARFRREMAILERLSHPHIVRYYGGGEDDGTLFYVMEYLTGQDLETLIKQQGVLPPERTTHLLEQACRSLEEAHASDLVHRDLKPANLYTCRLGLEVDVLKVLDFGLVHVIGESTARVGGTPGYIAPETLTGRVTASADIYALGCIAYTCLVGEAPFTGETVEEALEAHLKSEPRDVAAAAPQHIPPDLAALIMQCISREPADRPSSCSEIIRRLRACNLEWSPDDAAQSWTENPVLPTPVHPSLSQDTSSATVFSLF